MNERLILVDLARTAALLAMVAFHLRFDLVLFGLLPPDHAQSLSFYWHARLTAGSFLFLAGLSLWLGHGQAFRPRAFWRREAKLAAAALLITAATLAAMPDAFIFFGILHAIALFSLLALPFLRLPALVTVAVGAAIMAASYILPQALEWNHPALRWLGLQTLPTATMDLEPFFPWMGPLLLGLGFGQLAAHRLPVMAPGRLARILAWPGRHSLVIYLVHQPLLFGLLWTFTTLA